MSERGAEFFQIIHSILTVEKKYSVKDVAAKMGMKEATLRARLRDDPTRTMFSADEIKALIKAAPDWRIVDYFLEGSPFIAAERGIYAATEEACRKKIFTSAVEADLQAGGIVQEVVNSLEDGTICHTDKERIHEDIDETEQALATLRAHVSSSK